MAVHYHPQPKPVKGTQAMDRRDRRKGIVKAEDTNKEAARIRDGRRCRMPHCPICRQYRTLVPQVAHVFQAKGMGGDPTLVRSQVGLLMVLDPVIHGMQERGEVDIVPLHAELGTAGPCEFYLVEDVYDPETSAYSSRRLLWEWETDVQQPANPAPLTGWKPPRRTVEVD